MNTTQKLFFTIDDIKELATSRSFERGENYFISGEVGKIKRKGNLFEETVYGSIEYNVSLDITKNQLNFQCNCPYDFGGICKHAVAFSFEKLDGNYSENTVTEEKSFSKEAFVNSFDKAPSSKKLKFLKQLLDRDINEHNKFSKGLAITREKRNQYTPSKR
jgi:uncharacterized Zn finger protein